MANYQEENMSNSIQFVDFLVVKWLGAMKNTAALQFEVVNAMTAEKRRSGIQSYGIHTKFVAKLNSTQQTVKAQPSVMRHGLGKVWLARIATMISECTLNTWVYKTKTNSIAQEWHKTQSIVPPSNFSKNQKVVHEWISLESCLHKMTLKQGT